MSVRQDLVQSAVTFLRDPAVASSPLSKRLSFLESKGLTAIETDEALRRASVGDGGGGGWGHSAPRGRYGQPEEVARDWRDWFVMTVIGGGVGVLMYSLARKFLFPALAPPSQTDLERAQAALEAKYDEAAALLNTLSSETTLLREDLKRQEEMVEGAVKEVKDAVEECVKGEEKRQEEMEKVLDEVEELKELMPRMVEKLKDSQTASLNDLQNELKSLKSLLLSRTTSSATPPPSSSPTPSAVGARASAPGLPSPRLGNNSNAASTSFAGLANRPPGIPAWQLAATTGSTSAATTPPPSMPPKPAGVPTAAVNGAVNGEVAGTSDKGGEVETVKNGDAEGGASLGVAGI